jgi:hypothetical protein
MPQTPAGNLGLEFEHTIGVDDFKNSYDANWLRLDTLAGQPFVTDDAITAEPGAPAVGDAYILQGTQTGTNWGTDTGAVQHSIALFTNLPGQTDGSPWLYLVPRVNWRVYVRTQARWSVFDATGVWFKGNVHRPYQITLADTAGDYVLSRIENQSMTVIIGDAFDDVNDAIVLPNNATEAFAIGTRIRLINRAGAPVDFEDGGSVTWEGLDPTAGPIEDDAFLEIERMTTNIWKVIQYEANGTHASDVAGYAADPSIDFKFSRVGGLVTVQFPLITGTSDATTKNLVTALPASLRPLTAQNCLIAASDSGGADALAEAIVGTDGDIDFHTDTAAGAWTASGTALVRAGTLSYNLQ